MRKIKNIFMTALLASMMLVMSFASAWADEMPRLIDIADLFTPDEEYYINSLLDKFREDHEFDAVVLTTREGLEDPELTERADDYYDYEGFGRGTDRDGCLLLIDMESRMMHVSTTGYGITVLTDYGIDVMTDDIAAYLGDEDYTGAIKTGFLDNLEMMYQAAEDGEPFDVPDSDAPLDLSDPYTHVAIIGFALIPGLIFGFFITRSKKKELISVRKAKGAASFMKKGSMSLSKESDRFLYSTVSATPKPEKDSGSGGSSTHIGSSGTIHGGGSKSF